MPSRPAIYGDSGVRELDRVRINVLSDVGKATAGEVVDHPQGGASLQECIHQV